MNVYKRRAYAKINLTLDITGVEQNYHLLDSLVASVDLYDDIKLTAREDDYSTVRMQGMGSENIPPETNNALKAAFAFSKKFKTAGVDISIKKNIPLGGGLGGSSADTSGVLYGMAQLFGVTDAQAVEELADSLGSDTRYMIYGGFKRMQGRGNIVKETGIDRTLHLLLLCPNSTVSAGACYKKYDELPKTLEWKPSSTEECIKALKDGNIAEACKYVSNDLYIPALHLNEDVERAKKQMQELGPMVAGMTGSGSCVFGIFPTAKACNAAKKRYQGEFCAIATKTVTP